MALNVALQPPSQFSGNYASFGQDAFERERQQQAQSEAERGEATFVPTLARAQYGTGEPVYEYRTVRPERTGVVEGTGEGGDLSAKSLPNIQLPQIEQAKAFGAVGGVGVPKVELEKFSLEPELEKAYKRALTSTERTAQELEQFQKSPERAKLLAEETERLRKAQVDEEGRAKRIGELEPQRKELARKAMELSDYRVDPSRIFGADKGTRFGMSLMLGISNVLSNIGESLQGKQATGAILGAVRDAIVRDVELQENDYRRSLQGLEARRTALGDLVKQVGDERIAADALAKQQAAYAADKMLTVARGLKDQEARNAMEQAAAQIQQGYGKELQAVGVANVQAANQLALAMAQMKQSASATNAQLAMARETANAAARTAAISVPEGERKTIDEILKTATEKRMLERDKLLSEMRTHFTDNPQSLAILTKLRQSLVEKVKRNEDAGVIMDFVANNMPLGNTPAERKTADLFKRYSALKASGQGGKAITGIEYYLFEPQRPGDIVGALNMLNAERGGLLDERNQLFQRFGAGSAPGRAFLVESLRGFVPDVTTKQTPSFQRQPSETR